MLNVMEMILSDFYRNAYHNCYGIIPQMTQNM